MLFYRKIKQASIKQCEKKENRVLQEWRKIRICRMPADGVSWKNSPRGTLPHLDLESRISQGRGPNAPGQREQQVPSTQDRRQEQ